MKSKNKIIILGCILICILILLGGIALWYILFYKKGSTKIQIDDDIAINQPLTEAEKTLGEKISEESYQEYTLHIFKSDTPYFPYIIATKEDSIKFSSNFIEETIYLEDITTQIKSKGTEYFNSTILGTKTVVFAQDGISIVYDETTNEVILFQRFVPLDENQYLELWGKLYGNRLSKDPLYTF